MSQSPAKPSRLDPGRRRALASLYAALIAANAAAWLWAWSLFADRPALLGTAFLAWVFGLRHAVDADHIAAIDNTVRKLVHEGRPAHAVGFFFSLGHSTVVVLAAAAIAAAAGAARPRLDALASRLNHSHQVTAAASKTAAVKLVASLS